MFPLLLLPLAMIFDRVYTQNNPIRIAPFFNDDQEDILYWAQIQENLNENLQLVTENGQSTPLVQRISEKDIIEVSRKFCNFIQTATSSNERVASVLAPKSQLVSPILESITSHLSIPCFITGWTARNRPANKNVFNIYPDADLLSRGLAKIVESFDWPGFLILYEEDDGLLKLQEILKLEEFREANGRNEVTIQKLKIGGDNRHILKSARSINRIIVDCHVDRIMDVLAQAQEVDLLSDFSRSLFLTSLDAHTLDFSSVKTQANITTVRLFNPFLAQFRAVASEYFPGISPMQIRVESALILDAMLLIVEALNRLEAKNLDWSPKNLNCSSQTQFEDDIGIIDTLLNTEISEGTLTGSIGLQSGKRDKFVLEVIETDSPEKPIGIFNSEYPEKIHLTRNSTEREAELQRRLTSYNFIVTSRIGPPYLFENKNPDAFKNSRYYGYSMDLISEVAKLMNISFEFRITEGNSYANLVQDLIERKADLGICDFTITPQRRELIDFSMPFMTLGIGILHKENTVEAVDNMYAFMRPISWTVWFYIWTLSLVSSVTMFFVARMAPGEWENPKPWDPESRELENIWNVKNFLWLSLGSITAQGCDILPKSVPTRVISAAWWFFSLIIMSSYTANLAAFLTSEKRDVTIDTVEELAAQSKIKYGLMEKGSTETFFATSNDSLYQKMWNTMKNEKPSVFEKDNPSGVERVLSTKSGLYAYFMESTGIEYELERKCTLRKIGGLLDSKSYGIGMPLNADYRHAINSAVLHLQESGKLLELKEKWWKENREGTPCERNVDTQSVALALSNVGGIFIVLAVGIAMAYFIALVEFLWHVRQLSIEEHLSYVETLKCELKFAAKIFNKKKRAKPLPSESSSSKSYSAREHDKMSMARSIFNKSISLLNIDNAVEVDRNNVRHRSLTKSTGHLRVY